MTERIGDLFGTAGGEPVTTDLRADNALPAGVHPQDRSEYLVDGRITSEGPPAPLDAAGGPYLWPREVET